MGDELEVLADEGKNQLDSLEFEGTAPTTKIQWSMIPPPIKADLLVAKDGGLPPWHWTMMNDLPRNEAYRSRITCFAFTARVPRRWLVSDVHGACARPRSAIERAVCNRKCRTVLDIGW